MIVSQLDTFWILLDLLGAISLPQSRDKKTRERIISSEFQRYNVRRMGSQPGEMHALQINDVEIMELTSAGWRISRLQVMTTSTNLLIGVPMPRNHFGSQVDFRQKFKSKSQDSRRQRSIKDCQGVCHMSNAKSTMDGAVTASQFGLPVTAR